MICDPLPVEITWLTFSFYCDLAFSISPHRDVLYCMLAGSTSLLQIFSHLFLLFCGEEMPSELPIWVLLLYVHFSPADLSLMYCWSLVDINIIAFSFLGPMLFCTVVCCQLYRFLAMLMPAFMSSFLYENQALCRMSWALRRYLFINECFSLWGWW